MWTALSFACFVGALASNTVSLSVALERFNQTGSAWWRAAIGVNYLVYCGIVAFAMLRVA